MTIKPSKLIATLSNAENPFVLYEIRHTLVISPPPCNKPGLVLLA